MKNINVIKIVSICLLIHFSIGCKPKPKYKDCKLDGSCPQQYYRMELGEAKAYLWAKPGSYWIYKNTATGDIDTQTCTGFYFDSVTVRGTESATSFITIKYDFLSRSISSKFNKLTYHDETERYEPDAPLRPLKTVFERYAGIGFIMPFSHPFVIGEQFSNGSSTMTCKGMDSNVIIQGKEYFDVAKFELDKDDIWEEKLNCIRANTIYYWSKNVGIIKKELKTCNYSWELIDYNIIQ